MELETNNLIWFEELQNRKKISKIFSRYEKTFPENERRSKEQFLDLAENPDAFVFLIKNEDETIGYCVIWELSSFYFLEHFEVFEEFRNQKFGEKILESLQEKFEKLILETAVSYTHLDVYKRQVMEFMQPMNTITVLQQNKVHFLLI